MASKSAEAGKPGDLKIISVNASPQTFKREVSSNQNQLDRAQMQDEEADQPKETEEAPWILRVQSQERIREWKDTQKHIELKFVNAKRLLEDSV
jgi:Sec-independent protein translocase protein TatA